MSGKVDVNKNPKKLKTLVVDRKDSLVRIGGTRHEVRLAGTVVR